MKTDIPSAVADTLCRACADLIYDQLTCIRKLEHALTMVRASLDSALEALPDGVKETMDTWGDV